MADVELSDSVAQKSDNGRKGPQDGRVRRTREALIQAFNQLVLGGKIRDIRVADVVSRSGVGRSTFYDHYSSARALHLDALRGPFAMLADAAAGEGNAVMLTRLLDHFWDYRARARQSFDPSAERLLATMVEERLRGAPLTIPSWIAARQLATAALTPIVAWLNGEAWCTSKDLAGAICLTAEAQLRALRHDV